MSHVCPAKKTTFIRSRHLSKIAQNCHNQGIRGKSGWMPSSFAKLRALFKISVPITFFFCALMEANHFSIAASMSWYRPVLFLFREGDIDAASYLICVSSLMIRCKVRKTIFFFQSKSYLFSRHFLVCLKSPLCLKATEWPFCLTCCLLGRQRQTVQVMCQWTGAHWWLSKHWAVSDLPPSLCLHARGSSPVANGGGGGGGLINNAH